MRLTMIRLIIAAASVAVFAAIARSSPAQSSIVGSSHGSSVSPQLRNRYGRIAGRGGTLVFATCNYKINHQPVDLIPSVQYAPNSLGKKHEVVDVQDSQAPVPGAPAPSGYTLDWVGVLTAGDPPITFDAASANFSISGTALDPNTNYYLFLYVNACPGGGGCGNWTFLASEALGTPVEGSLIGPSPLQNGFVFNSQQNVMALDLVH